MKTIEILFQHFDCVFLPNSPAHIAVAVSGGADSMALCLALQEWCQYHKIQLTALTVNHQLRPESSKEAFQVHEWLSSRHVSHEVLTWDHPPIRYNVQALAREARYNLMTAYCKQRNIPYLSTAHHQHDQWETFMMRLVHTSGIRGLSGIPTLQNRDGITVVRPFLTLHPNTLKSYLTEKKQPWIEDPSNQNTSFERIRWRNHAHELTKMNITSDLIGRVCSKLEKEAEALDWAAIDWIDRNTHWHAALKFIRCDISLRDLPEALTKRIMLGVASKVRGVSITTDHVRHAMHAPYERLCATPFKPFTMGGCYWMKYKDGLIIVREWGKCPSETIVSNHILYDHRFKLTSVPVGSRIRPINQELWPLFKYQFHTTEIPYQVFLSLPVISENTTYTWHEIDW